MGIMSNTVSIYQYRVEGEPGNASWVQERLHKNRFGAIDATADEEASGWVTRDDHAGADFDNENVFWRDPYYAFTFRRDQRRVPPAVLKNMVDRECARWLADRPAISRMPFKRKAEIREEPPCGAAGQDPARARHLRRGLERRDRSAHRGLHQRKGARPRGGLLFPDL